jgi:hypothetical protein
VTLPVRVHGQLEARPLPAGHRLGPIVATALACHGHAAPTATSAAPWPASYFGLDRVAAYRAASPPARQGLLAVCAADVLIEAFFVEKLGIGFAAKMVLLSPTADERTVYALMGADEARHMAAVAAYLGRRPDAEGALPDDPFLGLLARAIDTGRRMVLALLVQVVLEGWGLVHYRRLARAAADPALRAGLADIVKDEALHHGGGLAVVGRAGLSPADCRAAEAVLAPLLSMVRTGPQRIVARLEESQGPLGRRGRAQAFIDLDTERVAGDQLALLRGFLGRAPALSTRLDRLGLFRPLSPAQCAAVADDGTRARGESP